MENGGHEGAEEMDEGRSQRPSAYGGSQARSRLNGGEEGDAASQGGFGEEGEEGLDEERKSSANGLGDEEGGSRKQSARPMRKHQSSSLSKKQPEKQKDLSKDNSKFLSLRTLTTNL